MAEVPVVDPRYDPNVVIPVQWLKYARTAHGDEFNIEYARRLCVALMAEHGVSDWRLRIGGAHEEAGSITYPKAEGRWNGRPGTLTLSGPLMSLWTPEQARDTILHEIAHIMVPDDGHSERWKQWCRKLGCRPQARAGEGKTTVRPWVGTCPGGHPHRRRRRKPRETWYCMTCDPNCYSTGNMITWKKEVNSRG